MNSRFEIKQGPRAKIADALDSAHSALTAGKVIIAPIEHAYVFVADAFNHGAVAKIHQLRGDSSGVATQVLIRDQDLVRGLAGEFNEEVKLLAENFWPGLLTIILPIQRGLTWNLGDSKELGRVALRVPSNRFMRELLALSGPLAIASATRIGMKPVRNTSLFPALDSDLGATIDAGLMPAAPGGLASTIVEMRADGVDLIREGAISREELATFIPSIARGLDPTA